MAFNNEATIDVDSFASTRSVCREGGLCFCRADTQTPQEAAVRLLSGPVASALLLGASARTRHRRPDASTTVSADEAPYAELGDVCQSRAGIRDGETCLTGKIGSRPAVHLTSPRWPHENGALPPEGCLERHAAHSMLRAERITVARNNQTRRASPSLGRPDLTMPPKTVRGTSWNRLFAPHSQS